VAKQTIESETGTATAGYEVARKLSNLFIICHFVE